MVQSHPSKKRLPKAAHRPKRYRLGLHVLRQNLPDFQMVHNVDRPWGSHDRHANAASLFEWTSALIQLFFDQVEDQWKLRNEALHGRDDAAHSLFRRALLCAKATRLYAKARTLLALDRLILSRPLATFLDLPTIGPLHLRMTTMYKLTQ
jgi:hypothetical protein